MYNIMLLTIRLMDDSNNNNNNNNNSNKLNIDTSGELYISTKKSVYIQ